MNTIARTDRPALQPLLSAHLRFAAAVAIAAVLAFAWVSAEQASHEAVQSAAATFSRDITHITLPSVEIVGRREPAAAKARPAA